jgi:copper resistance protein B
MSDTNVPVVTESAMDAPAPPAPKDFAADRYFDPQIMATARAQLKQEHGGSTYSMVLVNIAEYAPRKGVDSYRWEGEAWHGGDINRLVVKSEGEGDTRHLGRAEIQVLYSRAIGPYFNLQAGLRYDIRPTPNRTYATIGFEGLAPYMFEVGGALFVSNKGDVLGRLDAFEDFRITQRFIVQPRAELNFAASDVSETGIGSGLSDSELGMRLRYEVRREFAPYLGVSWDQKYGRTQDLARAAGENPSSVRFVGGLRVWF